MRQRRGVTGSSVIGKGRSFAGSEQTFSTTERTSERILLIFKKTMPWIDADKFATEDGPWASDTVTNTYNNRFRNALSLQQPTGAWTNGFGFDEFARLTNVISPAGTSSYQYRDVALANGDHTACDLVGRLNLPCKCMQVSCKCQSFQMTLMQPVGVLGVQTRASQLPFAICAAETREPVLRTGRYPARRILPRTSSYGI